MMDIATPACCEWRLHNVYRVENIKQTILVKLITINVSNTIINDLCKICMYVDIWIGKGLAGKLSNLYVVKA